MPSDDTLKRRSSGGTSLIGLFLLMGVLAVAFAMVGHVQRGDFQTLFRAADELVIATIVVAAVSGSIASGVIGNRHHGGPWLTTLFVALGFIVGGLVGGGLWLKPSVPPVAIGCSLIVLYAAVIRIGRSRSSIRADGSTTSAPDAS
jgi:hypothetical protein